MQDRTRHAHAPPDPGLPNLLEIESRVATGMSVSTDATRVPLRVVRSRRGTIVWVVAVNSAPRTTKNITNSAVAWPNRPEPGECAWAALDGTRLAPALDGDHDPGLECPRVPPAGDAARSSSP
jgi:hypothetical protein